MPFITQTNRMEDRQFFLLSLSVHRAKQGCYHKIQCNPALKSLTRKPMQRGVIKASKKMQRHNAVISESHLAE